MRSLQAFPSAAVAGVSEARCRGLLRARARRRALLAEQVDLLQASVYLGVTRVGVEVSSRLAIRSSAKVKSSRLSLSAFSTATDSDFIASGSSSRIPSNAVSDRAVMRTRFPWARRWEMRAAAVCARDPSPGHSTSTCHDRSTFRRTSNCASVIAKGEKDTPSTSTSAPSSPLHINPGSGSCRRSMRDTRPSGMRRPSAICWTIERKARTRPGRARLRRISAGANEMTGYGPASGGTSSST